jgi:hypothetical protein
LQAKQFTTLQQSQTVDGHKVTIDKGYADANRIILGVLVTDPHGTKSPTGESAFLSNEDAIMLKTQQGQVLSLLGTESAVDTSNSQAAKEGLALAFNGADIQGNPERILLNLTIGVDCNSSSAQPVCKHTLIYRFALPFHAGRLIHLHQTVIANGHALTLEQVVITPSEIRLFIHWQKSDLQPPAFVLPGGPVGPAIYTETLYDLQLSAQDHTYPICQIGGGIACREGFGPGPYSNMGPFITGTGGSFTGPNLLNGNQQIVSVSLFQPLSNQHGTWTLTITKFGIPTKRNEQGSYSSTASPSRDDSAAPWIFTFKVP